MATQLASRPAAAPQPGGAGLKRRMATNAIGTGILYAASAATVGVLCWVLFYVAEQGFKYLGPEFLTNTPPGNPSDAGGGFLNGIIGSLIVVGLATVVAVPLGIGAAVCVVEYGGRLAKVVSFLTDVLIGIPTIVTGAFVYALWVTRYGFSGYAGAISLALVMLPLIVRATAEILRLVPGELREASLALGVTRARTIVSVVLPTALGGITTGIMLAVARAMGETAPLLLTALGNDLFVETNPDHRMSTLSLQIFSNAITGFKAAQARAWAGALTLVILVLLFTALARLAGRRSAVTSAR
ncbi:phosphate ABC transporter permease PstA [Streptomyces sp. NPDC006975]|uniref:phosphate ABC transporter permease PstA n=1 Tax=Streptomyces sp. NPDC006975 TaxID=3154310 RepID=UPI003451C301